MAYMESMGFIKRSQTVMQIGMGGGMKAGVNVWRALRDVQDDHLAWRHLNGVPVTGAAQLSCGGVFGYDQCEEILHVAVPCWEAGCAGHPRCCFVSVRLPARGCWCKYHGSRPSNQAANSMRQVDHSTACC